MFDPIIRGKIEIKRYSYEFQRQKTVEIVKWLEKSPLRPYSSRFIVVFSDGMMALYHKDRDVP